MSLNAEDKAYQILLECAAAKGNYVSKSLLLKLYTIQKEHQFEADRSISTGLMQTAILAEASNLDSSETEGEP